jgi:hypothetical protein
MRMSIAADLGAGGAASWECADGMKTRGPLIRTPGAELTLGHMLGALTAPHHERNHPDLLPPALPRRVADADQDPVVRGRQRRGCFHWVSRRKPVGSLVTGSNDVGERTLDRRGRSSAGDQRRQQPRRRSGARLAGAGTGAGGFSLAGRECVDFAVE